MKPDPEFDSSDDDHETLSILHLDMDSFYVSVEVLADPSLAGRPVIVGGTGQRGVVASASYEARAYGVRSAMPTSRARRLCPDAVFVQGDHSSYGQVSERLHTILASVTPVIEPIALDEAFLDVSAARQLFGSGRSIAESLRERILDELGLACSVGVAGKKLFAKLASEDAKPRPDRRGTVPGSGVRVIRAEEELAFLHALPVRALWGVGPRTFERLSSFGVVSVGDLAAVRRDVLTGRFGRSHGDHLHDLSRGIDDRSVESDRDVKSISHEQTFPADLTNRRDIDDVVVKLSDAVARRLRSAGLRAGTIQLKLRYGDFSTITRSARQETGIDAGPLIARVAKSFLDDLRFDRGVRLIGIAGSGLQTPGEGVVQLQLDTFGDAESGGASGEWDSVSSAIDEIRRRFGNAAIGPSQAISERELGRDVWGPEAKNADDSTM